MLVGTLSILILAALSITTPAYCQLDTATLSGRIADSTGAVVPNAQIKVVQTETNFESLTQTNAEGLFSVPSLRPGPYRLTIVAPGFKQYIREGLELSVGDNVSVDAALEVGGVSESVRVTAETYGAASR